MKAIVVRVPGSTLAEDRMIAYCKMHIAGYKCPTSVNFVDSLPKTPSGKVIKYQLRAQYADSTLSAKGAGQREEGH